MKDIKTDDDMQKSRLRDHVRAFKTCAENYITQQRVLCAKESKPMKNREPSKDRKKDKARFPKKAREEISRKLSKLPGP